MKTHLQVSKTKTVTGETPDSGNSLNFIEDSNLKPGKEIKELYNLTDVIINRSFR